MASDQLSTPIVERALTECQKYGLHEARDILLGFRSFFSEVSEKMEDKDEIGIPEALFVESIDNYQGAIAMLSAAAEAVLAAQQRSSIKSIVGFLQNWTGEDEGFTRVFSKREGRQTLYTLSYRCLDPALLSKSVFGMVHSAILMSGTLTPTFFYRDILGLDKCIEKCYTSPFPEINKLPLVVPQTTTKYEERSEENFRKIATLISHMVNTIPGNIACFFPSYNLQKSIGRFIEEQTNRPVLYERTFGTPEEKSAFLNRFKALKNEGAVLLGVIAANFAEGIDLPGDLLRAVIVIGLPLAKPDIETKALIQYYEQKYGNGWDYGYVLPAFTKTLQSAGRCIRTETDRGALIFLDTRYALPQYKKLFPPEWNLQVTTNFVTELERFYAQEIQEYAFSRGKIV